MSYSCTTAIFREINATFLSQDMRLTLSAYTNPTSKQEEHLYNVRIVILGKNGGFTHTKQGLSLPASYIAQILEGKNLPNIKQSFKGPFFADPLEQPVSIDDGYLNLLVTDPETICISYIKRGQRFGSTLCLTVHEWDQLM